MKRVKNKQNQTQSEPTPTKRIRSKPSENHPTSYKTLVGGKGAGQDSKSKLIDMEKRLRNQNEVLVDIAKSRFMEAGDLDNALMQITEASAKTLVVDRVNVWLYSDDRSKIYCIDHYEMSSNMHTKGLELASAEFPSYFEALEKERIIAAHDAHTDPRTKEFSQTYLVPNRISSLLDAPVWKGGKMIGLVCHEHVGPSRTWTNEDQNFAASIADFISLAFESRDRKQIEAELEESHSLLIATLESTADGILVVDREGKIIRFNKRFVDMWNIPDSIIESKDDSRALKYVLKQLREPERFVSKVKELYDQPESESYDVLEFKDGRFFERYSKPQLIGRNIIGRVWSFRDVTNRKRAEQALRESEERYRTLVEHTYDLISEAGADGRFLYLSPKHKEILGYEPEELEGKNIFENIHPDDSETVKREFKRIMETFTSGHVEFRIKHKNGEWRWMESSGKPLKTANGEVRAVFASRDITEKKIAEDALKESLSLLSRKNRYETIISSVTQSVHQSIDFQEVLENAVESMSGNIAGAENVGIWLVEAKDAVLKAYRGFPGWFVERLSRIPYPKGVTWKTISEDKPLYSANAEKDKVIGPAGIDLGTKSYMSMPIHYGGKTVGVINISSLKENAFDREELNLLEIISQQIEVAINNAKQAEALVESDRALRESLDQLSKKNRYETIISTVTRSVHQSTNLEDVMDNAVQSISENIDRADSVAIYIVEGEEAVLKAQRGYSDWYIQRVGRIPYPKGYAWKVIMDEQYRYCADVDQDAVIGLAGREFGIKSYLSMPILYEGKTIGVINVNSLQKDAFDADELKLLEIVREQITVALNNARQKGALEEALSEVERLKGRLLHESQYIRGGFQGSDIFKDVKGNSISLQRSLFKLYQYASSDSVILIQGETGTGKELIARSVHGISPRSQRSFICVNCEELPKETIEPELFGHEVRGSATGALSIRISQFEMANNGTIYLEEVGAIPLELQNRLLRIIQEGVFTRSANNRLIKVNVRVIASSKIDVGELSHEGKLSEELYNQINTFRVIIPPLRDRKEDIPLLSKHFIDKHGYRLGKKIDSMSQEVVEYLNAHDWPGNVRELDRLLEQAIDRSRGSTLELDDLTDMIVK
jgi:formate hydrogenlyase transcriptional activator